MPPRDEPRRPRRADAQRNYDLLLAAAREVFAERGADAPLDEIARRAGIGNATMYRHFPDRRELLAAVYSDELDKLCAQADVLLAAEPPGDALFSWLRAFIAHVADKRELALAIPGDASRSALFDGWHAVMHATVSSLLTRAQDAGEVSRETTAADLFTLASGIALAGGDSERADRCLALIRHGTAPAK
jgi:AcrR family transcriptional regulator